MSSFHKLEASETVWSDECGSCPSAMSFEDSEQCSALDWIDERCFRGDWNTNNWLTYNFELPPQWGSEGVDFTYTANYWALGQWWYNSPSNDEEALAFHCPASSQECITDWTKQRTQILSCTGWTQWVDPMDGSSLDPYTQWTAAQYFNNYLACYESVSVTVSGWTHDQLRIGFASFDNQRDDYYLHVGINSVSWLVSDFSVTFFPHTTTNMLTTTTTKMPSTTTTPLPKSTSAVLSTTTMTETTMISTRKDSSTIAATTSTTRGTTNVPTESGTTLPTIKDTTNLETTREFDGGNGGKHGGDDDSVIIWSVAGGVYFLVMLCGFWLYRLYRGRKKSAAAQRTGTVASMGARAPDNGEADVYVDGKDVDLEKVKSLSVDGTELQGEMGDVMQEENEEEKAHEYYVTPGADIKESDEDDSNSQSYEP